MPFATYFVKCFIVLLKVKYNRGAEQSFGHGETDFSSVAVFVILAERYSQLALSRILKLYRYIINIVRFALGVAVTAYTAAVIVNGTVFCCDRSILGI